MPNYNPALTRDLWVGGTMILADSTLASPYTSQAISVGREPGQVPQLTIQNPSSEVATVQASLTDVDANYLPFSTAPAGQVTVINPAAGSSVRLSLAAAPSAAITVSR